MHFIIVMPKLNFINKKYLKMDYNNLKSAIESGIILNDKLLLEIGINLNIVKPYDDKYLQFRILSAMNIIANHYKDFSTNLSPLKTIIIVCILFHHTTYRVALCLWICVIRRVNSFLF
jgi:hypothetical protein